MFQTTNQIYNCSYRYIDLSNMVCDTCPVDPCRLSSVSFVTTEPNRLSIGLMAPFGIADRRKATSIFLVTKHAPLGPIRVEDCWIIPRIGSWWIIFSYFCGIFVNPLKNSGEKATYEPWDDSPSGQERCGPRNVAITDMDLLLDSHKITKLERFWWCLFACSSKITSWLVVYLPL